MFKSACRKTKFFDKLRSPAVQDFFDRPNSPPGGCFLLSQMRRLVYPMVTAFASSARRSSNREPAVITAKREPRFSAMINS